MKTSRSVLVTVAASFVFAFSPAGAQEADFSFKSLNAPPGTDAARLRAVASATRFGTWPKPKELAVAPEVSRSLLSRPALVTREAISFRTAAFEGAEWGVARVAWQSLVDSGRPVPRELPPDVREKHLQRLTPAQRADPATVERYLARRLERERAAQSQRLAGEMTIEVALGPSAAGAQEYLLARIAENMLPTDALVATYRAAAMPEGLGDRAWVTESRSKDLVRVDLVRRNVVLTVSARGRFTEEALPLARRIDGFVQRQEPLTPEQLRSRRPVVTITPEPKRGALVYSVSAPEDVQVADTIAAVDGRTVRPRDRAIPLAGVDKAQVRVSVVTRELLVGTAVMAAPAGR